VNGDSRVVALVPARSGSKGLPDKNLAPVAGRSLLARAIETAFAVAEIDRCVVSTDGEEIAEEAARVGAEVHRRAPELATDDSPVLDTVRTVIRWLGEEGGQLVLLQPTSPLRRPRDVRRCLEALSAGADSAATFTEASLHPHQAFRLDDGAPRPFLDGVVPWRPRQRLSPPAYQLTGGVYAFWTSRLGEDADSILFGRVTAILVPRWTAVDVDDATDLEIARALVRDEQVDEPA
jgi:CMP-N,N'-diacetyllegionaminic acid synthase